MWALNFLVRAQNEVRRMSQKAPAILRNDIIINNIVMGKSM